MARRLRLMVASGVVALLGLVPTAARSEDPIQIIREIEEGIKGSHYLVVADRREAIRAALAYARTGDTVVIAGKGHETYQTIGDTSYAFDDRVVARELLDELVTGRNP